MSAGPPSAAQLLEDLGEDERAREGGADLHLRAVGELLGLGLDVVGGGPGCGRAAAGGGRRGGGIAAEAGRPDGGAGDALAGRGRRALAGDVGGRRGLRAGALGLGDGGLAPLLGLGDLALLLGLGLLGRPDRGLGLRLLLLGAPLVGDRDLLADLRRARLGRPRARPARRTRCCRRGPAVWACRCSLGRIFPERPDPNLVGDLRGRDRGQRAEPGEQAGPHQPLDHVVVRHVGRVYAGRRRDALRGRRRSSRR